MSGAQLCPELVPDFRTSFILTNFLTHLTLFFSEAVMASVVDGYRRLDQSGRNLVHSLGLDV